MLATAGPITTLLFKGGPSLINLLVDTAELRIVVTGPRMLFETLELVTTLSALDGATVQHLRDLAGCLEGTIHCGLIGIAAAEITVMNVRSGGILRIDLGPPSMYQSVLVLHTRTGETFRDLVSRMLCDVPERPFFVGLHAVPATGHMEHHHDAAGDGAANHGAADHGAAGHQETGSHPVGHGGGHGHT